MFRRLLPRLGVTAACLLAWRLLAYVPLPLASPEWLAFDMQYSSRGALGLLGGPPFQAVSVVADGLYPLLAAFVSLWMLPLCSEAVRTRWQDPAKRQHDLGWGTFGFAGIAAFGRVQSMAGGAPRIVTSGRGLASMLLLVAGTMALFGLGLVIGRWGAPAGYGIWFLFAIQVFLSQVKSIAYVLDRAGGMSRLWLPLVVYVLLVLLVVVSAIGIFLAVRLIPLADLEGKPVDDHEALPIHPLTGGVTVPIGLAIALMYIPGIVGGALGLGAQVDQYWSAGSSIGVGRFAYGAAFFALVAGISLLATWVNFDPARVTEILKGDGRTLRGVPGGLTPPAYLRRVLWTTNGVAALWLGTVVVVIPALYQGTMGWSGLSISSGLLLIATAMMFESVRRIWPAESVD